MEDFKIISIDSILAELSPFPQENEKKLKKDLTKNNFDDILNVEIRKLEEKG